MKKITVCLVMLCLLSNITACGYFLYPERVGQTAGKLDPTVILLDAAGLLIGVLPGVVAFAVDVTTGTIYLSPGEKSSVEKHTDRADLTGDFDLKPVKPDEVQVDTMTTASELSEVLGQRVNANDIIYYRPETAAATISWQTAKVVK